MRFWENVQKILDERGFTNKQVAEAGGVSGPAVSKYKTGAIPGLDVAARIAEFLQVSLDSLVWAQGGTEIRQVCPGPEEHALLREVVAELGLPDLAFLAKLKTNYAAWQVLEVLYGCFPTPVPLSTLKETLSEIPDDTLRGLVVSLRRKGLIVEDRQGPELCLRLTRNISQMVARELTDYAQHVRRAARILFGDVLPALEAPVRTGHLLTFTGRFSRTKAECLAHELNEMIRAKIEASADDEPGDTDIKLVFGVAYSPDLG